MLWRVEVKSGVYAFDDLDKAVDFIHKNTKWNKTAYVDIVHTEKTIVFEGKRKAPTAIKRALVRGGTIIEVL